MKTPQPEWMKRLFEQDWYRPETDHLDSIGDFISQEIQRAREDVLDKTRDIIAKAKLPIPNPYGTTVRVGRYNEVLQSLIDKITKIEKEMK